MPSCPSCGGVFEQPVLYCPNDGTALSAGARDPLVGRVVGDRYRLSDRLGRGAMGTVYRAVHTSMEKPVAIKLLRAELAGDADAVARFHREARSASRLDHEHCIRVTDFGQTDDGLLYLVMELLDGPSLSSLLARGPLAPAVAAAVAHDVALALAHAHERGVIHRDLKPDNVMLARRGAASAPRFVLKVLDFGLAKLAGETAGPTLTRAGSVFGTPEYMAPEQAQGLALDPRTDLYALGVMLYQLATGGLPFRAANYLALLARHVQEAPEPPRARRPEIPQALEALILACMAKSPSDRPASAEAVVAALAPLADREALSALLREPPGGPAPSSCEPAAVRESSPPPREGGPAAEASARRSTGAALGGEASRAAPTDDATEAGFFASPLPDDALAHDGGPPAAPSQRRLQLSIAVVLALVGSVTAAIVWRAPRPDRVMAAAGPPVDPLVEARRKLDAGDLDGAERLLTAERAAHDGAPLQLLLGELAERRGNRLGALAHYHRATRLAPTSAGPRSRLSAWLRALGQVDAACREAREALTIDGESGEARAIVAQCRARTSDPKAP